MVRRARILARLKPRRLFDDGAESPIAQPAEIDALLTVAAKG